MLASEQASEFLVRRLMRNGIETVLYWDMNESCLGEGLEIKLKNFFMFCLEGIYAEGYWNGIGIEIL